MSIPPSFSISIDRITGNRMAKMGKMDPNLMRSPGLYGNPEERKPRLKAFQKPPGCYRLSSSTLNNRHFLAFPGMARNRDINDALPPLQQSMYQGSVFLLYRA
jgi:hypothetical protein